MTPSLVTRQMTIEGGIALFDRQHYSDYEEIGSLWGERFADEQSVHAELFNGRAIMVGCDGGKYDVSIGNLGGEEKPYSSPHLTIELGLLSEGFWLDVPSGNVMIADYPSLQDYKTCGEEARHDGFYSVAHLSMPAGYYRVAVNGYLIAGNPFNRSSIPLEEPPPDAAPDPDAKPAAPGKIFVRQIVFNFIKMARGMAISMRKTRLYAPSFKKENTQYKEAMARFKTALGQ